MVFLAKTLCHCRFLVSVVSALGFHCCSYAQSFLDHDNKPERMGSQASWQPALLRTARLTTKSATFLQQNLPFDMDPTASQTARPAAWVPFLQK
eukprot:1420581-Amphidinium_carterae.1